MKRVVSFCIALVGVCAIAAGTAAYAVYKGGTENDEENAVSVKNVYSSENNETSENSDIRKLKKAVLPDKAAKNDVYYMMLNSVDYYDNISGEVYYPSVSDKSIISAVQFRSSLSDTRSYSHYKEIADDKTSEEPAEENVVDILNTSDNIVTDIERYCTSEKETVKDNIKKTYSKSMYNVVTLDNSDFIPNNQRVTKAPDGNPCYSYRCDPSNLPEARICVFPQEMAFGFLTDQTLWDISDITEQNGISCYHIKGKTNEEYGDKLNVKTFEMFVSTDTGVLIKYVGYNSDDVISDYIYTKNISFSEQ